MGARSLRHAQTPTPAPATEQPMIWMPRAAAIHASVSVKRQRARAVEWSAITAELTALCRHHVQTLDFVRVMERPQI